MSQHDIENSSESTTSSPRSHKFTIERGASQTSQSSARNIGGRDLTPPSSVASSQEIQDRTFELSTVGKKRSADGEVKNKGHSRNLSTLSQASTGSLTELSESLRTKLSYAMVKVQNGWQNHSIEEVESLASLSPRSIRSTAQHQGFISPRSAVAITQQTNSLNRLTSGFVPTSEAISSSKGLAPPATIVPGSRRRLAPATQLQINTSRPNRPRTQQRTPSQNAAMEADAVETLLFMSASPSNSGHFPHCISTSPRKLETSPLYSRPVQRFEHKSDFIDRVLQGLDADGHEDLNRALSVMEAHKSAKQPA